jgi:plastocyanin domain-containing protein
MAGENIIEFTPEKTGTIPYSCWMGMIGSSIEVVDDLSKVTSEDIKAAEAGAVTGGGLGGGACCGN